MRSFRQAYHNAVSSQAVPEELKEKTLERIKGHTRKNHIKLSVFIPVAAALITLSVVTVWADNIIKFDKNQYGFKSHIYTEDSSGNLNLHTDSDLINKIGTAVNKSQENQNLNVTVKNMVADDKSLFINFDIETKDGSPLQQDNAEGKSNLDGQKFTNSYLNSDGQNYDLTVYRLDAAENPNKASFEAMLLSPPDLNGKSVNLVLSDFYDCINKSTDIKFLYNSLADIYKDITPCPQEDFIKTRGHSEYADGSFDWNYSIPAGGMHIKFSNDYPDAYIDNMGFMLSGTKGCETEWLYISIVPGPPKNADSLKNLCFKNTETGYSQPATVLNETDGRMVVILSPSETGMSYHSEKDLALAFLSKYKMGIDSREDVKVINRGTWTVEFTANYKAAQKTFTLNKEVPVNGYSRTVKTVTLSSLYMHITFNSTGGCYKGTTGIQDVALVMKDGAEVPAGVKAGGGGPGSGEGDFEFEWYLKTAIDVDNVSGIKIWDTVIPLQ